MFVYKSEILKASYKWTGHNDNQKDVTRLDNLINEKVADGWEFVTYSYKGNGLGVRAVFVVTFRKQKQAMTAKELLDLEC